MNRFRGASYVFSVQCYNEAIEYSKLLSQQEDFWRQRAKQHWLKAAYDNKKYFYMYASARKKKNLITRLKDDSNIWHDWEHGLGELIGRYYDKLFQSNDVEFAEVLHGINTRISSD